MNQRQTLFDIVAQTGLWLIVLTGVLTILKPFFPDQWVITFAHWIQSDFDTLAQLAIQGLAVLNGIGLSCCMASVLVHEA